MSKDPARPKLFPFCSERCHMADLGRRFGEEYRFAGPPADPAALPTTTDED